MQSERNKAAMKTELYLKQKIRANIDAIIDCGDMKDIEINRSKIVRLWSSRDIYYVDINYSMDTSVQIKKLVVKKVYDAKNTFKEHKKIFDKIEEKNIRQLLPKTYFYIADGNYIVMDYVNGKPLLEIVLLKLAFRSSHSLIKIFTNLGTSLANFHNLFKNYNPPIILDKVVDEVIEKLKISEYFNKKEKSEIYEYLLRGNDLLGPDYKIPVSKLYNDWTIRNFIINKNLELKVVDTDAMVHPQFPDYDMVWYGMIYPHF